MEKKTGVADNDSMVRVDVFKVEGEGYYLVPIYVADTVKKDLPQKAVTPGKTYENWKVMDEKDFLFSLYPNDLIKIESKQDISFSLVNEDSGLLKTIKSNQCFVYYIKTGIANGSIKVITNDHCYQKLSLGVKTLKSIEKYQVDVLGKVHPVKKEVRQKFTIQQKAR